MRTEAILLIVRNCFEMWWPGTELNRRRQPFQGCALPPELPGHCLRTSGLHSSVHKTTNGRFRRALGALTGRDAAKHNSRCAGNRAELSNYSNPATFLKIVADDFSPPLFLLIFFSRIPFHAHS